ncbi:uncharacterized protein, partial [Temnothorax longispinosus]|uniref:uncharacterized protein n=1 Tax=Temnothorax longispinosus TaxID=300112 RepID=UPI003A996125
MFESFNVKMLFDENGLNFCKKEKNTNNITKLYQQLPTFSSRKDADFDTNSVVHLIVHLTSIITSSLNITLYPVKNASFAVHSLDLSLVDAIKKKDFHFFKEIIEDILKKQPSNSEYVNPINYVNSFSGDTYLDIVSRNGLTEFAVYLLHKGAEINRVNAIHNCGPIHFATESGHVATLTVLLEHPMINPNLEARQETALHIAVGKDDLTCAGLLLEKGASASIPNSKGLTALRLAAMKGQRNMVELILEKSQQYLDIDTSEDDFEETTREVMRRNLPDLSLPPKYFKVNVYEFEYYLIKNDETDFLIRMELFETEALHSVVEELLKMTVQYNCHKAMIGILEKFKGRRFNVKAAEMATLLGRPTILQKLLPEIEPEMANNLILSVCRQLGTPEKVRNMSDLLECLKLIFKQKKVNVRYMDDLGNTPLYYASQANCHEVVALLL